MPAPGTTDVSQLNLNPATVPPSVVSLDPAMRTPMSRQYSLGVEERLGRGLLVRLDGVLVRGRNLSLTRDLNILTPSGPTYPQFATVSQR